MNEIQIIRNQLSAERQHVAEVMSLCSRYLAARPERPERPASKPGPDEFWQACTGYLAFMLTRSGTEASRAAVAKLEETPDAQMPAAESRWRHFAALLTSEWDRRNGELDALATRNLSASDWRAAAGVDADSILEERRLYGRVTLTCPAGLTP